VGSYAYTYNNQPHAVRTAGAVSLQYDLAGNMTQKVSNGVTLGITWNADNRPTLITRNGSDYIQYTYDGNSTRVRKVNLATGFVTRYYGEVYEERGTTGVIHLFANTTQIASVRTDGTIQYYHGNHLGSASVITDSTGSVKETIEYLPFGSYRVRQDLDGSFPNVNYTFTDQEDDDETGLYNYKARLYDPLLGRFISADSIIPEPGNLQAFNRYSYCVNNPLVYTDSSGHWSLGDVFDDIGDFFSDVGDAVWQPAAEITAGAVGACIGGPIGAGIAVGLVRYGITGDANAALASAVQAGLFYGAGEVCPGNPFAHAAAGAAGGGIGAAITGQDIGRGMLVGGISGFAGTFAGGYMKGWDPAFQLIGRSVVGGVVGGIGSEIYGGSFAEGFKQGAITAGYAEIFNGWFHDQFLPWLRKMKPGAPGYSNQNVMLGSHGVVVGGGGIKCSKGNSYIEVCIGVGSPGYSWTGSKGAPTPGFYAAAQAGFHAGVQYGYTFYSFSPGNRGDFWEFGYVSPGGNLAVCVVF
jgi:RHS repeat-associated protein